jgi:hypothetical protein
VEGTAGVLPALRGLPNRCALPAKDDTVEAIYIEGASVQQVWSGRYRWELQPEHQKDPRATALGQRGGQKRMAQLNTQERSALAKHAAHAR